MVDTDRTFVISFCCGSRFQPWGRHLVCHETPEFAGWKPTPRSVPNGQSQAPNVILPAASGRQNYVGN